MKVDHQQNNQKYLREDSQLKIYFCHYHLINNKSQPNLNINFEIFEINKFRKKNLNNKYKQTK